MKAKLAVRPAPVVQRQPAPAALLRKTPAQPAPSLHIVQGGLDSDALLRLQAVAGNQAVGDLIGRPRLTVQPQAVECPPPPAPAPPVAPHDDPRFVAVKERVEQVGVKQKEHPSAKSKVNEAQGAAKGPSNEVAAKAGAAKVDDMSKQKPKGFDKAAFVAAVHVAIEKATPKTMEEVDDFSGSGKAAEMKNQITGTVSQNKDAAAGGIKAATTAPPDKSGVAAKPVTAMPAETPGAPPADVRAGEAMPPPRPAEQVSLDHTKCETDNQLAEGHVTEQQVANSNEPEFQDAMVAKQQADEHAQKAPQQFREGEEKQLGDAKGGADSASKTGLSQMHQSRASAVGHVGSHKDDAKAKNESERTRIANEMDAIYQATEKEVDEILTGLDTKVSGAFDSGEKAARDAFENDYKTKKDAYFDKRYSVVGGSLLWLSDKLTSPPAEVHSFIDEAKALYVKEMNKVIDNVANIVETELNRATARIQQGRDQIKKYVADQPKELRKLASEKADQISSDFDSLDRSVSEKSNAIVDDMAQKYVAASKEVDDRVNAMHEENKGLLDKAKDKIKGMIETIGKLKAMLASMAARAGDVVDKIAEHPIDFLGKLIAAVKQGFDQFTDKIWDYLKKGLLTWLFGEVAKAGLTLPDKFDLKGILMFLAQLLGLTWGNIRGRAVKILGGKIIGLIERGAAVVSKAIEIYNVIKTEGIAGVWHLIQDKVSEIKDQVLEAVGGMVVTEVIKAGVKWIIGLLNPVSALIKACIAIYDIIMFFVNHGKEIVELVNAIIDNLGMIIAGNISAAANMVEAVLGKAIPIAIGFLASLLGLGDLGSKIKAILEKIQKPVTMAVDWVLAKVIKPVASMAAKGIGWVKGKIKAGVAWVKSKGKAAIEKVKSKFGIGQEKDSRTPDERAADRDQALVEATALLEKPDLSVEAVAQKLPAMKQRYRLTELRVVTETESDGEEVDHIEAAASPGKAGPSVKKPKDPALEKVRQKVRTLKEEAESDPEAVWKLLDLYVAQADPILRALAKSDSLAKQVLVERIQSRPKEVKEDYRPPHEASAKVTDRSGRVIWGPEPYRSGGVTLALIEEHGWRRASQLTHTEVKAVKEAPLAAGVTLWITGQYDPCNPCQTAMRTAAASSKARVNYWWPSGPGPGVSFGSSGQETVAPVSGAYGTTPAGRPLTRHYAVETGPIRNIPGTVVDEVIDNNPGVPTVGGKTVYYDPRNNVTVVTGDGESIVSVHKGRP